MRTPVLVLIAVILAPSPATPGELDQQLVAIDTANARFVSQMLPLVGQDIDTVVRKVRTRGVTDEIDRRLGYGARRVFTRLRSGYSEIHLTLVAYENSIAEARIRVVSNRWSEIRGDVRATWEQESQTAIDRERDGFAIEERSQRLLGRMSDAVADELGPPPTVTPRGRKRRAVKLLVDPARNNQVGSACGLAEFEPEEHRAARLLEDSASKDLLEVVLRGVNPEGRVYAAAALRRLARAGTSLEPHTEHAIRRVIESDLLINVCSGCEVSLIPASEVIEENHSETTQR